ncbi:MAG: beta-hydroxyacyl-ACP dehydratase [Verrucomicrobiae bacterium]|nr:beta-hydroxyacyl-ACP dehydratase [Verrucomicrobiae bacterium]
MTDDDPFRHALIALPHGPEFRFVDRLTSLDDGKSASATYRIRGDESFLAGHFPEHPLMPGVILIEAVAQLAGIVAQTDPEHAPLNDLKLTAVRQAKILGSASPGETLVINARVVGRMGHLIQAEGTISSEGSANAALLTTAIVLSGTPAEGVD